MALFLTQGCVMGSTRGVFDFPVSDAARAAPWPGLLPLDHFVDGATGADPRLAGLEGDARTMYLRMIRLRAKAAALSGPVLTSSDRGQMTAAIAASQIAQ